MASAAMRPSMGALNRISSAPTPLRPLTQTASLSTTTSLLKRHKYRGARDNKDHSKHRGESAIRRTGTRWRLSMSDEPLPQPVPRSELPPIETDPDHGLWEFFADRKTVTSPPAEVAKHGRAWTAEELRHKSWDDLHRLWWVCVKERNRIATSLWELNKGKLGFGEKELTNRDFEVRRTMRAIKHVLTERFYAWEDAVKLAEKDPEVNLTGNGPAFTPSSYLEQSDTATRGDKAIAAATAEQTAEKAGQAATEVPDPAAIPSSQPQAEATRL